MPVSYKSRILKTFQGFAFIEFKKPDDAERCVNEFTKMGCKLPTGTPPEELTSIKTFGLEPQDIEVKQKPDYEPPKKKSRKKEKKEEKCDNWQLSEHESETDIKANKSAEVNNINIVMFGLF